MLSATRRHSWLPALVAAAALCAAGAPARAGTASALFLVTVQLQASGADKCHGLGRPLTVECGIAPGAMTVLEPSHASGTLASLDAWLVPKKRTTAYGGVYAASLTTRIVRFDGWEYVETLVSW